MSTKYKFHNPDGVYFITFAVVEWVDVFTRKEYRDILIENLKYCQSNKGLEIFAWCIMSNHLHLIVRAKEGFVLQDILRDYKKFTSKKIIDAIANNSGESRKEWLLEMFKKHGEQNSNNISFAFVGVLHQRTSSFGVPPTESLPLLVLCKRYSRGHQQTCLYSMFTCLLVEKKTNKG